MSIAVKMEEIWYRRSRGGTLLLILAVISVVYGFAVRVREGLYRSGLRGRRKLPVPCVSVGNLVVGGSGKTPLVSWIVSRMEEKGRRPCIVSRGYGGSEKGPKRVVTGEGTPAAALFGDEPAMLARIHETVPVVVAGDRWTAGMAAVRRWNADIVVADDAFQHRRLERDLDIVVVDGRRWFGNGRIFPAGPLREDVRSLARADVVVVRGRQEGPEGDERMDALRRLAPNAIHVEASFRPVGWKTAGEERLPVERPPEPLFSLSGLADPGTFSETLERLGFSLAGGRSFRDHHRYSERELLDVDGAAAAAGARAVVTTEKDAERIGRWPGRLPLLLLAMCLEVGRGREKLEECLDALGNRGSR